MKKASLLLVEDVPFNIDILVNLLCEDYNLFVAKSGESARSYIQSKEIDLVLLDINLPDVNGIDWYLNMRIEESMDQPVIFVSGEQGHDIINRCLENGAVDYVTKPYDPKELLERIRHHVGVLEKERTLRSRNNLLEDLVKMKTQEITKTRDAAIRAVSSLVESRDSETSDHINRTQNYVLVLAETLKVMGHFSDLLTNEYINDIEKASPLHDIGKVGIPDQVLLKPGKLTAEEFEIIKTHPLVGFHALNRAQMELGNNHFFDMACDIVLYHHEKWDGSGYPKGVSGEEIPLSARIMALADVYDALISKRVYKESFSHNKAKSIIEEGRGKHFDPRVVDAFLIAERLFEKVSSRHIGDYE